MYTNNYRYWSDTNPRELHEEPLHSAISFFGVLGPYMFQDDNGNGVHVIGKVFISQLSAHHVVLFYFKGPATEVTDAPQP